VTPNFEKEAQVICVEYRSAWFKSTYRRRTGLTVKREVSKECLRHLRPSLTALCRPPVGGRDCRVGSVLNKAAKRKLGAGRKGTIEFIKTRSVEIFQGSIGSFRNGRRKKS